MSETHAQSSGDVQEPLRIEPRFRGDAKVGRWWLASLEKRFVERNVGRVPGWLETHHLTLLTIPWCAIAIAAGYAAGQGELAWLSLVSVVIALQYLTDLFDGAVGRARNTGLVRWGYFMDHLLDFAFLCSVAIAYAFVIPTASLPWLVATLAASTALMAAEFLAFGATGEFRISHLGVGPTELRAALILANQAVVWLGTDVLALGLPWLTAGILLAGVCVVATTQRRIWDLDMQTKARSAEEAGV